MNTSDLRITKLRDYLVKIIDTLTTTTKYQINANMLSNEPTNYSLDKMPVDTEVENWIIGVVKRRDVYSFRSRMDYSVETINNLQNIGFFEEFEEAIKSNNDKGVLPDIENVEKIECLNCGTMNKADTNTAEFDIQIQVTYRDSSLNEEGGSL